MMVRLKTISDTVERSQWHHSTGEQFKEAFYILIKDFDVFTNSWRRNIQSPSYYCAGLATEHFLKAYLSFKSILFSREHNLTGLIGLDELNIRDFFGLTNEDIEQINILNKRYFFNESYGKNDLRYPSKSGLRISPHPDSYYKVIENMDQCLSIEISRQIRA